MCLFGALRIGFLEFPSWVSVGLSRVFGTAALRRSIRGLSVKEEHRPYREEDLL